MDTITLTHQGHTVALAAPQRLWFAAHIEALPDGHPRKRLVIFMALYAREILTGRSPAPTATRTPSASRAWRSSTPTSSPATRARVPRSSHSCSASRTTS